MSNIIQIKSGLLPPPNGALENFELGYATNDGCLYIGVNEETVPVKVVDRDFLPLTGGTLTGDLDVLGVVSGVTLEEGGSSLSTKYAALSHSHAWSTITSKPADNQFPNTAQAIGGSENLNSYTTPGFYYQNANANASSGSNYPVARAGTLIVTKDAGTTQMYYEYSGGGIYYRTLYGSTWSAWKDILTPAWASVSGKPTTATRWPTWSEVTSKPSTFSPSSHTHAYQQVARVANGLTGSITKNTWVSVSFGKTFPSVPSVVATGTNNVVGESFAKVRNVTRTGFEIVVGGGGNTNAFRWIAILAG